MSFVTSQSLFLTDSDAAAILQIVASIDSTAAAKSIPLSITKFA